MNVVSDFVEEHTCQHRFTHIGNLQPPTCFQRSHHIIDEYLNPSAVALPCLMVETSGLCDLYFTFP